MLHDWGIMIPLEVSLAFRTAFPMGMFTNSRGGDLETDECLQQSCGAKMRDREQ